MSETINDVIEFKMKFVCTTGQLTLTTTNQRPVRVPNSRQMKRIWLECGGCEKFDVRDIDKCLVTYGFTIKVNPGTSPTVREDFRKFLAKECRVN